MTKYELQGRGPHGDWDADNASWNPEATLFDTEAEAQAELNYWVKEGRKRKDLAIVEVEVPDDDTDD